MSVRGPPGPLGCRDTRPAYWRLGAARQSAMFGTAPGATLGLDGRCCAALPEGPKADAADVFRHRPEPFYSRQSVEVGR
jgi:hypothetical protein